jgi:hypothetical protein
MVLLVSRLRGLVRYLFGGARRLIER